MENLEIVVCQNCKSENLEYNPHNFISGVFYEFTCKDCNTLGFEGKIGSQSFTFTGKYKYSGSEIPSKVGSLRVNY